MPCREVGEKRALYISLLERALYLCMWGDPCWTSTGSVLGSPPWLSATCRVVGGTVSEAVCAASLCQ